MDYLLYKRKCLAIKLKDWPWNNTEMMTKKKMVLNKNWELGKFIIRGWVAKIIGTAPLRPAQLMKSFSLKLYLLL